MVTRGVLSIGERAYRARRVTATFGRIYLGIKANQFAARYTESAEMERRWKRFHERSARSIFQAAVELGGLILKGCQFIGSRSDILPPEYTRVLSQLQDRVPPRPFSVIRDVIEYELGASLESVFSEFSRESVASASLAQVHRARLADGRNLAVKVQYPEIAAKVRADLANLRVLFRAVGYVERNFDLSPLLDELSEHLPRELDFYNEGLNAERVAKFFEHREDLQVPKVCWELTTTRLLVSDFVDGIKISEKDQLRQAGVDCKLVMKSLVEAYCEQILVNGFFHADPHPGNLMVLPPTEEDEPPTIVFLDFGLAKQLPPGFRQSSVRFAAALLQGDTQLMADAMKELGFETRENSREALRSIAGILLDVAKRLRNQTYLDPAAFRQMGQDLPRQIRENPIVRIPGHLVLVGRVFALLSGLGSTLGVRLDMIRTILPYTVSSAATGAAQEETS
jgi:predicted unusual protein kinase regulating ubiquinone biosynthesis (AarF/ABC1/UbiB family)